MVRLLHAGKHRRDASSAAMIPANQTTKAHLLHAGAVCRSQSNVCCGGRAPSGPGYLGFRVMACDMLSTVHTLKAAHAVLELWQAKTADKLQPGGRQALTGTHMLCRQGKRDM